VFKWRQNSPSTGFASWSRIDTTCLNTLCHCCGRKAWAARAQSFTLWQQATLEITRSLLSSILVSTINCSLASQASSEVTHQDNSIGSTLLLLVCSIYKCVLFFTPRSWWITHSTQRQPKVCSTTLGPVMLTNRKFDISCKLDISCNLSTFLSQLHQKASWSFATVSSPRGTLWWA